MSFHTSNVKESSILSDAVNQNFVEDALWITPSEKLISELPLPLKSLNFDAYLSKSFTKEFLEAVPDFDVYSDDVYVCSLPKCGSSWTTTIVWLLTYNLDYETLESNSSTKLISDFDAMRTVSIIKDELLANDETNTLSESEAMRTAWINYLKSFDAPRIIKSHHQAYFLPKAIWTKGAKVIYVVRNPKDMAMSGYYFLRNFFRVDATIDDVVNGITNNVCLFSPKMNHILNFWKLRHLPNVCFVYYEDLVNDAFSTIKSISDFLGCRYSDEQLKDLTEYVSFKNMKNNKAVNRETDVAKMEELVGNKRPDANFKFLRKGKVGGYRDDLNEDQIKKLEVQNATSVYVVRSIINRYGWKYKLFENLLF